MIWVRHFKETDYFFICRSDHVFDHRVRCFWLCYLVRCRRTNSPGFVTKIWHWLPRHGRLSWRRLCGGCRWSTAWSSRNRRRKGRQSLYFFGGKRLPSDPFLTSLGCGYVYNRPGTEAERGNKVCTFVGGQQYPSDLFLASLGCGYVYNRPGTEAEMANKVCTFVGGWAISLRSFPHLPRMWIYV